MSALNEVVCSYLTMIQKGRNPFDRLIVERQVERDEKENVKIFKFLQIFNPDLVPNDWDDLFGVFLLRRERLKRISGVETSIFGVQRSVSCFGSSVSGVERSVTGVERSVSGVESSVFCHRVFIQFWFQIEGRLLFASFSCLSYTIHCVLLLR